MCVALHFLNKPSEKAIVGSAQLQRKGLYVRGIPVLEQTLGEGQWVRLNSNKRNVCMCVAFQFLNKSSEKASGLGSTTTRGRSVCV